MAEPSKLGVFLRSRRERVSPADVGLPESPRRRTPGLRREELAMLANISADYLVRLEQGRETSPSASVLASLSDVLGLDEDERRHLGSMVVATTHTEMCPAPASPATPVAATTLALLRSLDPTPAVVLDATTDLLAWNDAYARLMGPLGLLAGDAPNLLRFTFTDGAARTLYRDWNAVAREQVAALRAATARCAVVKSLEALIGELSVRSAEFARLWAKHDVRDRRRGIDRLFHPTAGPLDLAVEVLLLADPSERRLVAYLPANETSAAALESLIANGDRLAEASARPLRLVDGGAA